MPTARQPDPADASEYISVDDLYLDEFNPRLGGRCEGMSQSEILAILWREFAVDEVAMSIAANGFFSYEPLFADHEVLEGVDGQSHLAVVEGNRRLAAVKILRDSSLRRALKANELPTLSAAERRKLDELPVITKPRAQIWRFIGFKHVNGPQQWDAMAKAEYIAWVHNDLHVSLADIARQIGDQNATVVRLYAALMALNQAEEVGVFHREERVPKRFFFSHLYTGLGYSGIQTYLGIGSGKAADAAKKNPVPKAKVENLGNLCRWLYGDKATSTAPLIKSQNPHLRQLDEALQSKDGVTALEQGLPLGVALDVAKGDARILREAIVGAKTQLQTAKARVVTGFDTKDRSLLKTAEEAMLIAESVYEEMKAKASPTRSSRN